MYPCTLHFSLLNNFNQQNNLSLRNNLILRHLQSAEEDPPYSSSHKLSKTVLQTEKTRGGALDPCTNPNCHVQKTPEGRNPNLKYFRGTLIS
jgi:hypothetical protein